MSEAQSGFANRSYLLWKDLGYYAIVVIAWQLSRSPSNRKSVKADNKYPTLKFHFDERYLTCLLARYMPLLTKVYMLWVAVNGRLSCEFNLS